MKKRKKIILIVSLSLLSAVVTYFAGGLIATKVVSDKTINVRGSTIDSINEIGWNIQKNRNDYESLKDRTLIQFKYKKTNLQGYLYEVENPKGIVISAHGVNSFADSNHSHYQDYFVNKGWDVFSFDMIGCGRSEGKGMVSLAESRFCVEEAIKTVQNYETTKDLPIYLIGHSWGAYGVVAASDKKDVKAVVSFAGFDQPAEAMYGFAEHFVSSAVILTKPALDFSISILEGQKGFFSASNVIKNNKDIKYIVIHGDKDETVPLKKYSTYAHIENKGYENAQMLLLKGFTHSYLWNTQEASDYIINEVYPKVELLKQKYNNKVPKEEIVAFNETIDKNKASEVNTDLLNMIEEEFISSFDH